MDTNVQALQALYVSLGGTAATVKYCVTSVEVLNAISALFDGASDAVLNPDAINNIALVIGAQMSTYAQDESDLVNLVERDITSFTIPTDATSIGQSAFNGCASLESITIGSNVTSIGQYAFSGCTSLESVVIPDSVTSIGQYAFSANTALASVDIGTGITTIPASVFTGCSSLMSLTVRATTPPSLTASALTNVPATCVIYVPSDSVDAYKAATNWSSRADYIQAISE